MVMQQNQLVKFPPSKEGKLHGVLVDGVLVTVSCFAYDALATACNYVDEGVMGVIEVVKLEPMPIGFLVVERRVCNA